MKMKVKLKIVKNEFCNFFCYIFASGFGSQVATKGLKTLNYV